MDASSCAAGMTLPHWRQNFGASSVSAPQLGHFVTAFTRIYKRNRRPKSCTGLSRIGADRPAL